MLPGARAGAENNYRRAVSRALPLLLLVSLVAAAGVRVALGRYPVSYQVHYSYLISLSAREKAEEYRFDGFYALQATDLFTATLAAWIGTPELIAEAYEAGGVPVPSSDPRQLTRAISARKTAPQLIEVTVRHRDEAVARALAEGLRQVVVEHVTRYDREGIPTLTFKAVATEPWVGQQPLAINVITVATFVGTLLIGLNIIMLWASRRASLAGRQA